MKYIDSPGLTRISNYLNRHTSNGTLLTKVEAYSHVATREDRQLTRRLQDVVSEQLDTGALREPDLVSHLGVDDEIEAARIMSRLVMCLKLSYQNYQLEGILPQCFTANVSFNYSKKVIDEFYIQSIPGFFPENSFNMWKEIEECIGPMENVAVYSYISGNSAVVDDPFLDEGVLWHFNFFFVNNRRKRTLFFSSRIVSASERSALRMEINQIDEYGASEYISTSFKSPQVGPVTPDELDSGSDSDPEEFHLNLF